MFYLFWQPWAFSPLSLYVSFQHFVNPLPSNTTLKGNGFLNIVGDHRRDMYNTDMIKEGKISELLHPMSNCSQAVVSLAISVL